MTLTFFEDAKGLWLRDEGEDGAVLCSRSSIDISVTDGSGCVLDGTLLVNGTHFEVKRGKCKMLTEALHKIGFSDIEFISVSGVKRPCSYVQGVGGLWYFPNPRVAMSDEEILQLLRGMERMREKLASAKALCSEAVSEVLGI